MKNTAAPANKPIAKKDYEAALRLHSTATTEGGKLIAEREAKYKGISEKYDTQIQKHKDDADKAFQTIKRYAEQNRKDLFGDAQSIDTVCGKIGFRIGAGKLVLPEDVEGLLKKFKQKGLDLYIIKKEDVDKNKLKTDITNDSKLEISMEKLGVTVNKEESFYIKP